MRPPKRCSPSAPESRRRGGARACSPSWGRRPLGWRHPLPEAARHHLQLDAAARLGTGPPERGGARACPRGGIPPRASHAPSALDRGGHRRRLDPFLLPDRLPYDVLRGLEYLRSAGVTPDDRMAEAIDIVRSKPDAEGRWPLENPHPGEMHFEIDEGEGKPSRWNALRAMQVLPGQASVKWIGNAPGEGAVTFVPAADAGLHGINTANTKAGQVFHDKFGEECRVVVVP